MFFILYFCVSLELILSLLKACGSLMDAITSAIGQDVASKQRAH